MKSVQSVQGVVTVSHFPPTLGSRRSPSPRPRRRPWPTTTTPAAAATRRRVHHTTATPPFSVPALLPPYYPACSRVGGCGVPTGQGRRRRRRERRRRRRERRRRRRGLLGGGQGGKGRSRAVKGGEGGADGGESGADGGESGVGGGEVGAGGGEVGAGGGEGGADGGGCSRRRGQCRWRPGRHRRRRCSFRQRKLSRSSRSCDEGSLRGDPHTLRTGSAVHWDGQWGSVCGSPQAEEGSGRTSAAAGPGRPRRTTAPELDRQNAPFSAPWAPSPPRRNLLHIALRCGDGPWRNARGLEGASTHPSARHTVHARPPTVLYVLCSQDDDRIYSKPAQQAARRVVDAAHFVAASPAPHTVEG